MDMISLKPVFSAELQCLANNDVAACSQAGILNLQQRVGMSRCDDSAADNPESKR